MPSEQDAACNIKNKIIQPPHSTLNRLLKVTFMPWQLQPRKRGPHTHCIGGWMGSQMVWTQWELKPGCPAYSLLRITKQLHAAESFLKS